LFFDPALINAVEATAPYNTNRIAHTTNDLDGFTRYAASAAYDPFINYIRLGSCLSSGLFVWHTFGIKPSNDWATYGINSTYRDAKGGHDNPKFHMGIVATPPKDAR
jgi:hypothetical protein